MTTSEYNPKRRAHIPQPTRTSWLHIGILEGQGEDQLEESLCYVELEAVLGADEDQGAVEKNGFPAVNDGPDIKHVEQDSNSNLVLVWYLIVVWLCKRKCLPEEFNVVPCVESRTWNRSQKC